MQESPLGVRCLTATNGTTILLLTTARGVIPVLRRNTWRKTNIHTLVWCELSLTLKTCVKRKNSSLWGVSVARFSVLLAQRVLR